MSSTNWKDRVKAKRAELLKIYKPYLITRETFKKALLLTDISNIFNEGGIAYGFLTAREKMMTEEPDAVVVLDMLRRGEWSCTELVTAYIKR